MSTLLLWVLASGAAVALGVWIVIVAFLQPRPDLVGTLAAARPVTPSRRLQTQVVARQRWQAAIEDRLGRMRIAVPAKDLAILGLSKGRFLLRRVGVSMLLLLTGPVYATLFWAVGLNLSFVFPQVLGILLAVTGWFVVGMTVRDRAIKRRREMRYALVSYLTLVALHRAAGLGMGAALTAAAEESPAWTFRRIGDRIAATAREGESPWVGLAELAGELGIHELGDIASISHTAGNRGAGVYSTLMARASSLRRELQKSEEAAAAATSTYLVLPMLLMLIAAMGFLAYPALINLTTV